MCRITRPGVSLGRSLLRELTGMLKYRVRRFRIVYSVDRRARVVRLMAVGHRRNIFEDLAETLRR